MATLNIDGIWSAVKNTFKKRGPSTYTKTYDPQSTTHIVTAPLFRDHLTDIFTSRQANDSRDLLQSLFKQDPDVSAAVGAYLTLSDTPMRYFVRSHEDGTIMPEETKQLHSLVRALTGSTDYTRGFEAKPGLRRLCQELRYMLLLRGALGAELVFDKQFVPTRFQNVDMADVEWVEKVPGEPYPEQVVANERINLNVPNFFVAFHRRDPTTLYSDSDFVSCINTIAARQQVINDLYRIMQVTGFPRIHLSVVEEVVAKSMPASIRDNPVEYRNWLRDRMREIGSAFNSLRADQPFISYDSTDAKILNEKNPGAGIDISKVIEVLNSQNQAALKTMATVIGRGNQGTNTASVEARIAAMNADQLNVPLAEFFSRAFTFLINVYGILGYVDVTFEPAELRPNLELETHRVLQATRLQTDLSLGIITDEEYHLIVHGRLPPPSAPLLSGTGFANQGAEVRTNDVSPNQGGLDRSLVPEGSGQVRSNENNKNNGKKNASKNAALQLISRLMATFGITAAELHQS